MHQPMDPVFHQAGQEKGTSEEEEIRSDHLYNIEGHGWQWKKCQNHL
jgi:hypothetical protein